MNLALVAPSVGRMIGKSIGGERSIRVLHGKGDTVVHCPHLARHVSPSLSPLNKGMPLTGVQKEYCISGCNKGKGFACL